ncbi:DUF2877 domain-containing protein [Nonomuraea ferruginea]
MTVGTHVRRVRAHVTGAASTAVRPVLEASRRPARVLAAFPAGIYLEVRTELEPAVIAVVTGPATRLPNSMLLAGALPRVTMGDEAFVGDGSVDVGGLSLRARRWWDPSPRLGEVDPATLPPPSALAGRGTPGLDGNDAVELLAASCASGWLLGAVTAAERLVGLGPGLTPSGDDVLAGLLVTLRHLGGGDRHRAGGRPGRVAGGRPSRSTRAPVPRRSPRRCCTALRAARRARRCSRCCAA